MPETKPGIFFNEKGICNACVNTERNNSVDWEKRYEQLKNITEKVKLEEGYNCLIPVSGGKDSTFLTIKARELGLAPVCVSVEPVYITELGRKNLNNLSKLGFDVFVFKPNQKIMPQLLKRSFIEDGQPVRAFEFMLYSVPMQLAIDKKIPLVIWGENPQFEYGNSGSGLEGSAAEQKSICAIENRDSDYWIEKGITKGDLVSFQHPTANEIKKAGVTAIYLSHYMKFDSRKIAEFSISHGLTVRPDEELLGTGGYWNFEQLDDEIPVVSHLLKYLKYGYGRATDQACRDIRWGYLKREEGLELAEKYDGKCNPDYIKRYCDYIGIDEEEFWKIANSFLKDK